MRSKAQVRAVLPLLCALAACVPWTVKPLADGAPAAVTPAAYVESIWGGKLVPAVLSAAVDARELLDAMAAAPAARRERYAIVKGRGIVLKVDTRSRAGLALVDIAPFDQRPDLSIQIGPVLRGSTLRDATGVVRFSDFVNQMQFADAGSELNKRVWTTVLEPLDRAGLEGRSVSFAGTLEYQAGAKPPLAELIPVVLTVEERR